MMKAKVGVFQFCLILGLIACQSNQTISEAEPAVPSATPPTATPAVTTTASATAAPTLPPTTTATPLPPTSSPTPVPTATNEPLPLFPLALPLPASQDFLFVQDGRFLHWQHQTQEVVQPVDLGADWQFARYVISENGRTVVMVSVQLLDGSSRLDLYDPATGETHLLRDALPANLSQLLLSPDGRWLALLPPAGVIATGDEFAAEVEGFGEGSSVVYLMDLASPDNTLQKVGSCLTHPQLTGIRCHGLTWSPDSANLYWFDQSGFWQSAVPAPPQLLFANELEPENTAVYSTPDKAWSPWSPDGRYLEATVRYGPEGGNQVIYDLAERQILTIPQGGRMDSPRPYLYWLADGRLLIMRIAENSAGTQPTIEIYRIEAGQLVLETSQPIPGTAEDIPTYPLQVGDELHFLLINAYFEFEDWRVFKTSLTDLSQIELRFEPPAGTILFKAWLIGEPAYYRGTIRWQPDGSGFAWTSEDRSSAGYWSGETLETYLITAVPRTNPCCLHWLP